MKGNSTTLAIRFSNRIRSVLKIVLEVRARLGGGGYYCNALHGESEYNISINSDLSVSCNCQDSGSGTLGYLNEDSFEDVFFGAKANSFRETLATGKLPILTCARCSELKRLKRGGFAPSIRLPYRGLMLENTIACNLDCPGCIRKEVLKNRRKVTLGIDDLSDITHLLVRLGLKKLFYLNRGEPFISSRIEEELKIIREKNPKLHSKGQTSFVIISGKGSKRFFRHFLRGCSSSSVGLSP